MHARSHLHAFYFVDFFSCSQGMRSANRYSVVMYRFELHWNHSALKSSLIGLQGTQIASKQSCINVNVTVDSVPVLTAFNPTFQVCNNLKFVCILFVDFGPVWHLSFEDRSNHHDATIRHFKRFFPLVRSSQALYVKEEQELEIIPRDTVARLTWT